MTEIQIQVQCVQWFWNAFPESRGLLFEVNNNPKSARDGARRKAMGMVSGVSDLILFRKNLCPICIEMKDAIGRQSNSQKEWQLKAEGCGYDYRVIRSLKEFKELF